MNEFWKKIEDGTAREYKPVVCMDPKVKFSNSLGRFVREKWDLAHGSDKAKSPRRSSEDFVAALLK